MARRRRIRKHRRNPEGVAIWLAVAAAVGVVGYLIYEHVASAQPALPPGQKGPTPTLPVSPGTPPAPQPSPAPAPSPDPNLQTSPIGPEMPQGLTTEGHQGITIYEISDESTWTVLECGALPSLPDPGFPGAFIVTDTPSYYDPNMIAVRGTGADWLVAQLNAGHRVFVAPAFFETTHANARFVALDAAPPAYLEVLVAA